MKHAYLLLAFISTSTFGFTQHVINPYQNFSNNTTYVSLENIGAFDGEYQICPDLIWWGLPYFNYELSYKIEVVSFPFMVENNFPVNERKLVMPLTNTYGFSEGCNGFGWNSLYSNPETATILNSYEALFDSEGNGLMSKPASLSSQYFRDIVTEDCSNSEKSFFPHTVLKHKIYVSCDGNKIDSLEWVYDLTRGRMRNYPFVDNYDSQTATHLYDVVYRPEIFYLTGQDYSITNNDWITSAFPLEQYSEGTYNTFPPTIPIPNCDLYPEDESELFEDFLYIHPASYTLLDAPIRDQDAAQYAGYNVDDGILVEKPLGLEHEYIIDKEFDLRQINPSEKVIYNPSAVDIYITGGGTLTFPSGYTFKTVHGRYPTQTEFNNIATADLIWEHPNDVDVPSTLPDVVKAEYNVEPGSTLWIEPCVKIMDCIINVADGAFIAYDDTYIELVNVDINYELGEIQEEYSFLEQNYAPQQNCLCDCEKISFYHFPDGESYDEDYTFTWQGFGPPEVQRVNGPLFVESGVTLTFQTGITVEFGPKGSIVVEQGGRVVADGVTFTSACEETMWKGIELWGDPDALPDWDFPNAQAKAFLYNAIIEDAEIGIALFNRDDPENTGGARLRLRDSHFINNYQSIKASETNASPGNSANIIDNNTFEIIDYLADPKYGEFASAKVGPAQIELQGGRTYIIMDNQMSINAAKFPLPHKRGAGIMLTNQYASIFGNTINNFNEGIWSRVVGGGLGGLRALDNTLNDNIHGLVLDNTFFARVYDNTINVPAYPSALYYENSDDPNYGANNHVGIYVISGYGNIIEENDIIGADLDLLGEFEQERFTFGIVASETGTQEVDPSGSSEVTSHELYLNKMHNLQIALQIEGNNGITGEFYGLELECNEFTDNNYRNDVRVVGNMLNDSPPLYILGSLKDQGICNPNFSSNQADNKFTSCDPLIYDRNFQFDNFTLPDFNYSGYLNQMPICIQNDVLLIPCTQNNSPNSCESGAFDSDPNGAIIKKLAVDSILNQIEVDLNIAINNNDSIGMIENEKRLNYYKQKRALLSNRIIHEVMLDSLGLGLSLEELLSERAGTLHQLPLLAYYLEKENWPSADSLFSIMELDTSWIYSDDYLSVDIVINARMNNLGLIEAATIELEELEAQLAENRIQSYSSKIFLNLMSYKRYKRKPWIMGDTLIGKSMQMKPNQHKVETVINLWPNPTNSLLNYTLNVEERIMTSVKFNLKILNSLGKQILEQNLPSPNGSLILDNNSSGIYFIQLFQENELVQTSKIILE